MGSVLAKCLEPPAPSVLFTVCNDGAKHEFGEETLEAKSCCIRCGKTKEQIDQECEECREGRHEWVQEAISSTTESTAAPTSSSSDTPVVHGAPVLVVHRCKRCGLRFREDPNQGVIYDDYYMYGGGYMLGAEMMAFGMMYGAADVAYQDYAGYYGDDMFGDDGFDADGGFDMMGDF